MLDIHKPPLPPVRQRAVDDVEVEIEWPDGHRSRHFYRPGAAEFLVKHHTVEVRDAAVERTYWRGGRRMGRSRQLQDAATMLVITYVTKEEP